MSRIIRVAWLWVVGLFHHPWPAPAPAPAPTPRRRRQVGETKYAWTFRGGVLDRLDEYWGYIGRMRKCCPDDYALFSRAGGVLLPPEFKAARRHDHYVLGYSAVRPSFGCVSLLHDDSDDDENVTRFITFRKLGHAPDGVEWPRPGEDIYDVSWYFMVNDRRVTNGILTHHIGLCRTTGTARLLRERRPHWQRLPTPRKKGQRHMDCSVPQVTWGVPPGIKALIKDPDCKIKSVDDVLGMFRWAVEAAVQTGYELRITVRRHAEAATFAVDVLRMPYFFRDREFDANPSGTRKRIFHIVRTHRRRNGQLVRSHFRGARHFRWGGYGVSVSMPGKHHERALIEFDTPFEDESAGRPHSLDSGEVGDILHDAVTR